MCTAQMDGADSLATVDKGAECAGVARRSSRMALAITINTEPSWNSMPAAMVTPPISTPASRRPTVARAMTMFWRMLESVRRASEMASGSLSRSSPISAMSAVSTATTEPAAPMATPTAAGPTAGALQVGDDVELVLGQQAGVHLVDAGGGGHRIGHRLDVAGEHDDLLHTRLVQRGHHGGGVAPDLVGHGDHAQHLVVHGNDHGRAPLGGEFVCLAVRAHRIGDAKLFEQGQVANQHPLAIELNHLANDRPRRVAAGVRIGGIEDKGLHG